MPGGRTSRNPAVFDPRPQEDGSNRKGCHTGPGRDWQRWGELIGMTEEEKDLASETAKWIESKGKEKASLALLSKEGKGPKQ